MDPRLIQGSCSCVLAGKPSSFFPDDSFIDSGEIDVGRRATQKIPPGIFWRSQVFIDHPVHLKFNVSLGKAALVGIYGRKGLPPSHTQVMEPHFNSVLLILNCLFLWLMVLLQLFLQSYYMNAFLLCLSVLCPNF